MNVLIFEDEKRSADRLQTLLLQYDPHMVVLAVIGSIQEGLAWFEDNPPPDLIFQDIVLEDGICFDLFAQVDIQTPIIFTTAHSDYALRSFEVNSIDYLVKPYSMADLKVAIEKVNRLREVLVQPKENLLYEVSNRETRMPKKRFLVKIGDRYTAVPCRDVAYLTFDGGATHAVTFQDQRYVIDNSIASLSGQLDSEIYFQINRKFIIHVDSIQGIHSWFNSRLKVELSPSAGASVIVSRERVKAFKEWLDR